MEKKVNVALWFNSTEDGKKWMWRETKTFDINEPISKIYDWFKTFQNKEVKICEIDFKRRQEEEK